MLYVFYESYATVHCATIAVDGNIIARVFTTIYKVRYAICQGDKYGERGKKYKSRLNNIIMTIVLV